MANPEHIEWLLDYFLIPDQPGNSEEVAHRAGDVRLRLAICVPPQYFGCRLRASGIVRSDVWRSFRCHLLKLSPTFAASSRIGSSIPYAPSGVPTAGDGCSMEEAAAVASGPSELAVSNLKAFWLSI